MKTYRVKHVDAFTVHPFSGNPAGVVLDAKGLSDVEMQLLAREKNLPETAFVLPSTSKDADLQIRWFTPAAEVPLCGHATIAGFHALAEEGLEGMSTQGQHYFKLQTKSGILSIRVEKNFQGTTIEFELPLPAFRVRKTGMGELLKPLGLKQSDLDARFPVVSESYLYIPVRKLKRLLDLAPDFAGLKTVCQKAKLIGVCVFSLETVEKSSAIHSRFFAPAVGINEDPVTGSANGPLGVYLSQFVLPQGVKVVSRELADGRIEFVGEQGFALNRPGHVKIRVGGVAGRPKSVSIAGEAVTIMNSIVSL
ncbi:MAG TPA: PhzF family phenazine biosynthesis protein [Bacteroidota bacterium]|nr:PhzF family phenazine biosynthesis protein [Bacteroidota bacterium]